MEFFDIFIKVFLCLSALGLFSGLLIQICSSFKLYQLLRYMESKEAFNNAYQNFNNQGSTNRRVPFVTGLTAKEKEGDFVVNTDESSYIQEEAKKLSYAAGISDNEAVDLIMKTLNESKANSGNVANV